jgi:hypothetical protein
LSLALSLSRCDLIVKIVILSTSSPAEIGAMIRMAKLFRFISQS